MSEFKQYLGDGVYADYDNQQIVLTTDNGYGPFNTIYMESEVLEALDNYRKWLWAKAAEKNKRE
jgi:hypothetical protein